MLLDGRTCDGKLTEIGVTYVFYLFTHLARGIHVVYSMLCTISTHERKLLHTAAILHRFRDPFFVVVQSVYSASIHFRYIIE